MPWDYSFDARALKELKKLDPQAQREILRFLDQRIQGSTDPRLFGKPLRSELAGLWRYRVAHYRILCQIQDHHLIVLVVAVGDRKTIYE